MNFPFHKKKKMRIGGDSAALEALEIPQIELDSNGDDAETKPSRTENPYLSNRRAWDDRTSGVVQSRQTWQLIGLISLFMAAAAVGGIIYIGSMSKYVPYVVEVNKLGEAVAAGPADAAAPVDERVVQAYVAEFISDARMVTPDITLQRQAVLRVYAMLRTRDAAYQQMNAWLQNGDGKGTPFKRAAKEMVAVAVQNVLKMSPSSWQVDWTETTSDRTGAVGAKAHMRALVTVYVAPPVAGESADEVRKNPLGVYVKTFSWQRQAN